MAYNRTNTTTKTNSSKYGDKGHYGFKYHRFVFEVMYKTYFTFQRNILVEILNIC